MLDIKWPHRNGKPDLFKWPHHTFSLQVWTWSIRSSPLNFLPFLNFYKKNSPYLIFSSQFIKMGPKLMSSIASLFLLGALLQVVAAVDHDVGGDFGWNLPSNTTFFSDWARNKAFSVGDKLGTM